MEWQRQLIVLPTPSHQAQAAPPRDSGAPLSLSPAVLQHSSKAPDCLLDSKVQSQ
eukprot:CAMPEP_0206261708 /NCGR_PEP_ID=MMETSP0047_2-20121206/27809_1 /ASSEMBLY_ACC=CAM_ASM_000192 /TAXON_ID=195065 /ORGANISM="Chroomonas mesostigmatica_cf, Strain CCMP1168" /LENGTH=54 /DNA_ID=CAMNT_0053688961 /DNA_START=182 /DNA_END=346 /DNA_ORIENTATION=+